MVKHLVDIGDQITLHGETGQRCELDDTQIVGILRLRGLNVFARMTEAVLIHLCVGRLLCPSLHRGGAQKRRRAVDGHGIGTAHAMTARITEGQRRVDGAFDGQQTIQHSIRRARGNRVLLHPLLAARTTARRRIRAAAERGAFLGKRAATARARSARSGRGVKRCTCRVTVVLLASAMFCLHETVGCQVQY